MKFSDIHRAGALALIVGLSVVLASPDATAKCSKSKKCTKGKDVMQTISASPQHKQLTAAIKSAGLEKTLHGKGPFTVFAPTDEAFGKSKGKLAEAAKDKKKLAEILKYHVVPRKVSSHDIKSGGSLKTAQGEHLITQVKESDIYVDGSKVLQYDVPANNGMIFFVDEVLAPERGK